MPFREAATPESLPCPRCASDLRRCALADATAYECVACRGVFVEAALLPRITDALDLGGEILSRWPRVRRAEPTGSRMYLPCPRCRELMARRLFADGVKVVIDTCEAHGTWFDDSELRAVAEAAASGALERGQQRRRVETEATRARAAAAAAVEAGVAEERFWLLELVASLFSRP